MVIHNIRIVKQLNYYKLINKYYLNYYTFGFYNLCIIYGIVGLIFCIFNNLDEIENRFIIYLVLIINRTLNFGHRLVYNVTQELYELSPEWKNSFIKTLNYLDNILSAIITTTYLQKYDTTLNYVLIYTIIISLNLPYIYFLIIMILANYHRDNITVDDTRILRLINSVSETNDNYEQLENENIPYSQENIKVEFTLYKNINCKDHDQCVICLEEFEDNNEIVILECGHYFKKDCAIKWLHCNKVCPLCRTSLEIV
jgi:hypothetical protein